MIKFLLKISVKITFNRQNRVHNTAHHLSIQTTKSQRFVQ